MNIVGIINYGIAGNIHSIKKAVEAAGGRVIVINKPEQINDVDKLILPGVGSFNDGMNELNKGGFIEVLKTNKKPVLGICLGMQILSEFGYEYGKTKGLGFFNGEVRPIIVDGKVPHVGFNSINVISVNPLLKGLENKEFYFMHSFEVVNYTDIASLTKYSGHLFVSSIYKDNMYGVQFHPEKSRAQGVALFKNFLEL